VILILGFLTGLKYDEAYEST